jgi:hypothetical protein
MSRTIISGEKKGTFGLARPPKWYEIRPLLTLLSRERRRKSPCYIEAPRRNVPLSSPFGGSKTVFRDTRAPSGTERFEITAKRIEGVGVVTGSIWHQYDPTERTSYTKTRPDSWGGRQRRSAPDPHPQWPGARTQLEMRPIESGGIGLGLGALMSDGIAVVLPNSADGR